MSRFFISYRREDAAAEAGRLYDLLSQRFGPGAAFMDVDTIRPGVDYRTTTEGHLRECDALLAVIGRHWEDIRDEAGRRRLDVADDLVRFEIEVALARRVAVIPVLINGAQAPSESTLPDSLKPLSRFQAIRIDTPDFRRDSEKLLDALSGLGRTRFSAILTRWEAAVAVSILLLVGVLAFTRVQRAPAEIRLIVSQLGFRIAETRAVVDGMSVGRLGVAGVSETRMPGEEPSIEPAVLLEAASPTGRISLPALVLEMGTWVWFDRSNVPAEVTIGLKGPLQFQASIEGRIKVGPSGSKSYEVRFDAPASVHFKASSTDSIELSVAPIRQASTTLSREVRIDSLSLTRIEEAALDGEPVVRPVSPIEGGTVAFWSGAGPVRDVNQGDWMALAGLQGELKTVTFRDGMFDVRFAGTVQGLRVGSSTEVVNVMPTYVEALWANYRLLFLVVVGLCFVLTAAAIRKAI